MYFSRPLVKWSATLVIFDAHALQMLMRSAAKLRMDIFFKRSSSWSSISPLFIRRAICC